MSKKDVRKRLKNGEWLKFHKKKWVLYTVGRAYKKYKQKNTTKRKHAHNLED